MGLAENLALAACNIRVTTIFLGQLGTQVWQNYHSNYYERNKNKKFSPRKVVAKIVEMIFEIKHYKNGDLAEMYNT